MKKHCAYPVKMLPRRASQRGVVLLLVLISIAMASVLAVTFLTSQSTSIAIADNVNKQVVARGIAESGMVIAMRQVQTNSNWRNDFTHGVWVENISYNGGTYTISGYDGEDLDGDGEISQPDEGDGDLADDSGDVVTLKVTATFEGVTHTIVAVITAGSVPDMGVLLHVVANKASLTSNEQRFKALAESWGWTVVPISQNESAGAYNTALADAKVVYISEDIDSGNVNTKLNNATAGIVNEEGALYDELGMSSNWGTWNGTTIEITDNTHYITSPFPTGDLVVSSANNAFRYTSGTIANGAVTLAERYNAANPTLSIMDIGGEMTTGQPSPRRQVSLPWGEDAFNLNNLNESGLIILRRSLEWASNGHANATGTVYDYANRTQGVNIWAYQGTNSTQVPGSNSTPNTQLTGGQYDQIEADDNAGYAIAVSSNNHYAQMRYVIDIDEAKADVQMLKAKWVGRNANANPGRTDGAVLHIWNYASGSYEQVAVSANTESEVTIEGTVTANVSDYIGGSDGKTVILLATSRDRKSGGPHANSLTTDYVSLTVNAVTSGPTLVALYEFAERAEPPVLVGHWKLNEVASGPQFVLDSKLTMHNDALIDSYKSANGTYASQGGGSDVVVATNSTSNGSVMMYSNARIRGNLYIGEGGNPGSALVTYNSATVTGTVDPLPQTIGMPSLNAPGGSFNVQGHQTYNGGTYTIDADTQFNNLTFNNNAALRINGNVRLHITGNLTMNNGSITLLPGATLELHVGGTIVLHNNSAINNDTTATNRLTLYQYGNNKDLTMTSSGVICGTVYVSRNLTLNNNTAIFGRAIAAGNTIMYSQSAIHIDTSLPGFGGGGGGASAANDEAGGNNGIYQGPSGGEAGHGDGSTAVLFDGNDDYIEIPHTDDYLLDAGTLSVWFKPASLSGKKVIISKDSAGMDTGGHLELYTNGTALIGLVYSTTTSYQVQHGSLAVDEWYHAVLSWGPQGMQLHVNNVLRDTDDYTGGLGESSGGDGNYEPMAIGAGTSNSGNLAVTPTSDHFAGVIDDVRIYDQQLDAVQVDLLYNGQDPAAPSVGNVVEDTSNFGDPLNLVIDNPANIDWLPGGGLEFTGAAKAISAGPATKIYDALTARNQYTIEVIFQPANTATPTLPPSRIVSMSQGTGSRNFTFGQNNQRFEMQTRTTTTNSNGTGGKEYISGDVLTADTTTHVIITYDGTTLKAYQDGNLEGEKALNGVFSNWDDGFAFMLGNETTDNRHWLGKIMRVAIYDTGLNAGQVNNLFNGQPPGDGTSDTSAGFTFRWIENP